TYIPPGDANMPSQNGLFEASAAHGIERTGKGVGFGAVKGIDPDLLSPCDYAYALVINSLSLDVSPDEVAYAGLFATDSRFATLLWSLEIYASAPLSSAGTGLSVVFASQSLLGLDDGSIRGASGAT